MDLFNAALPSLSHVSHLNLSDCGLTATPAWWRLPALRQLLAHRNFCCPLEVAVAAAAAEQGAGPGGEEAAEALEGLGWVACWLPHLLCLARDCWPAPATKFELP